MNHEGNEIGQGFLEGITQALQVLSDDRVGESGLRASFRKVSAGLGAERAFLARVGQQRELAEVLESRGLSELELDAVRAGRSSPGLSVSVVHRVLETGQTTHVEDSRLLGADFNRTAAFVGGEWSVVCAPVCDPRARVPVGVLYFQTRSLRRPLRPAVLPHVQAYALALFQGWHALPHARRAALAMQVEIDGARQRTPERARLLGASDATRELREWLDEVVVPAMDAPNPDPILILGPTGSGKDVVAQYLHARSVRSRGRFVGLNCGMFRGDVLEAKLFGHVKGSFTGAVGDAEGAFVSAHGGVLFLDEVGDMPEEGQVMLLRALESGCVRPLGGRDERRDVQVICATNVDLEAAVAAGRFRSDLYHRINGLCAQLKPLCERREDVPVLLAHYIALHEQRTRRQTGGLTPDALELLQRYDWPGNVRELKRTCSLLVLHARPGQVLDGALLARVAPRVCNALLGPRPDAPPTNIFEQDFESYEAAVQEFERAFLEVRLKRFRGNRAAVARHLRLPRTTLYRYLVRAGLLPPGEAGDEPGDDLEDPGREDDDAGGI